MQCGHAAELAWQPAYTLWYLFHWRRWSSWFVFFFFFSSPPALISKQLILRFYLLRAQSRLKLGSDCQHPEGEGRAGGGSSAEGWDSPALLLLKFFSAFAGRAEEGLNVSHSDVDTNDSRGFFFLLLFLVYPFP